MPDTPKSLHQQSVDYAIQRIGQLSAELAARDLMIMDLKAQLESFNAQSSSASADGGVSTQSASQQQEKRNKSK